ncbi:MAG TPA: hypothetical protein DDZ80_08630 [Cyanobacteria bacterium UBA8803]|nr:hypothetical protein [Cyanobacteria bacterium UBA9273]HBL58566.1 hypothetical protein [Cyanobacteria bacterium UBA8803]
MKKLNNWGKPVAQFAVGLSVAAGLLAPATVVNSSTTNNSIQSSEPASLEAQTNWQLAQGLVGQCRAAKKRIFIYTERSTSSRTVTTLDPDEEMTLADNGNAGWVAISAPETGYVQARDLKPCKNQGGNTPNPDQPSGSNLCRKVTVAQGLTIRREPSPSSTLVGGIFVGNTVKLANPRQSQKDSQGRTWIEITAPKAGWISSGFPEGNLGPEFSCP